MEDYRYEKNDIDGDPGRPASYGTSNGLFGETDRDSGEYHFRSGYTHQVYSNAHYVPAEESAATPKYYRPYEEERPVKASEKKKKKKGGAGVALVLLLCFLSALVGGGAASFLTAKYLSGDFTLLPGFSAESEAVIEQETETEEPASGDYAEKMLSSEEREEEIEPTPEPVLSPAEIYSVACMQAVSIGTDIVNVDRYGNQIPAVISGSGFIVSSDGYIITNYHVVDHAVAAGKNVSVTAFDGTVYIGSVVGYDYEKDLAVVKIEADGLYPAELGDSDGVLVGDPVYAVGNPYGVLEFTMTVGHISALNRLIATDNNEDNATNMFQIDAAVYSGNSGGPAYDEHGRVIGIVSAKYLEDGMEGIGFAIPINDALPVINELLDKGYVGGRASVGATFDQNYNTVLSRYYHLPEGAYISKVARGGCAEKAGIRAGDIIMKIGEYTVDSYADIPAALRHFKAGDTADIIIFRDGNLYSASIVLDEEIPDSANGSLLYYGPSEST